MSNKKKGFNKGQIDTIITLHLKGVSSRAICDELDVPRSRKSSVNDILARWRKGDIVHSGEVKDAETRNDVVEEAVALDTLCDHPDWNISSLAKRLRSAQRTNNQLRKVQRDLFDGESSCLNLEDLGSILAENIKKAELNTIFLNYNEKPKSNKTVEILWSDWQWGKVSESWNTEIAANAAKYYGEELVKIITETCPEKIIFSALGDNFEDALKHGVQSTASTDTSNAEQMANCIQEVWFSILSPVFSLGIPVEFVGVSGNHGASEHKGMDMFKAGRYGMDYTLYRTWENMCKIAKFDHVTFNLPEGHFATYEIYGKLTVAEHGYSCKGSSENAMIALRNKRATNLQKYVNRLVIGDLHHYCNYDNGNLQINGAAFGVAFDAIEYSGIMGFHAVPAQIVNIHEPVNGVGQNTVLETKVIQVAKGYNYGL